ncbi:hypothetical protein [Mucilaginibacter jinjuensis]|uniref:Uncharacterized protein n=1 Tax=Mucilaginibacter jinjuensis TaxID=1176721 RepID=A0ABY7TAE7_9SPHI|nr:hypothetical protein [Mucilaginibacter jinjuensis]WCT13316.1 hypothetical protein PQO05_05140 [Mucilaginibacter jinjuensis]
MASLLNKLGVPRNVRLFFEPYYQVQTDGSICFAFGDELEHVALDFHRVPTSVCPWTTGEGPLIFISFSAMEAIAFLSCYAHSFPDLSRLQFIAVGNHWGNFPVSSGKITLLFGQDILGCLTDIKVSTALQNKSATIWYQGKDGFDVEGHRFAEMQLTLNAFEKALGIRSGIRTVKPRRFNTFFEQLKHQNL